MIPDFKTFLKESVWMDIHKRSVGDAERKEEDIDILDLHNFGIYLDKIYRPINQKFLAASYVTEYESSEGLLLCVHLCEKENSNYVNVFYNGRQVSVLKTFGKPWYEDLNNNFNVSITDTNFVISSKDGSEVTNSFYIKVIDFMLDHIPPVGYARLINKVGVNESVWMDIHKRSVGDTDRKEENVNLLDFDGLYDYIESNYSLSDEDTLTICHKGPKPVGICVLFGSYSANNTDYDFHIDYKKNDVNGKSEITFYKYLEEKWGDLIQKLKDKFVLVDCGHNIFGETTSAISILPQSRNVDNKFFLDVIDFISQNTTSYIKRK